jgi:predicted ATPase
MAEHCRRVYLRAMGAGDDLPLRGRTDELAAIDRAITRARAGTAAAVALVGEPGIGKSRLAAEAADRATRAGCATRWGRAWESGGTPPYWPWRQVCEGFSREGPIAALWGRRGDATDPVQARFELFDAVGHELATAAARQPQLCILDDLHAADLPSLELVAFVTRHLRNAPIAWLLTWRDVESKRGAVAEPLARITREATVVPLARLSDADANAVIDDHRGGVAADLERAELRDRLVRAAAGNPLFLVETLAAVATGRVAAGELEQLPIAEAIAAIARDRHAHLPAELAELAVAASVVGRDVPLARWAAAAARDPAAVRRDAPALVAAGVVTEIGADRWRFGHDLVREAIYRGAGDAAIVETHRRLALDADHRVVAGEASLVGERAHHALHARLPAATAVAWTIAAADHARGQCAYEDALATIDLAAARLGPEVARDTALTLARGRALLDLGVTDKAGEAFVAAAALAREAGDAATCSATRCTS